MMMRSAPPWRAWALAAAVAAASLTTVRAAETLQIVPLVSGRDVVVSFELADAYTDEVREAIGSGLLTSFTYDVELRMSVPGWIDRTIESTVVTVSNRYDNLTRSHTLSRTVNGRIVDTLVTEDEAAVRQWLTTIKRLPICPTSKLETSRDYFVRVRARRRPFSGSMLGWASTVIGQARFNFIP